MPDFLSGPQIVLLGLLILVIGFLLRRSFVLNNRSRMRDSAAEVRQEIHAAERSAASGICKLEIRLHDYGREVEGRVQTTLTLLDRLILEADQESQRLLMLLGHSGQSDDRSDTPRQPDIMMGTDLPVVAPSSEENLLTAAAPLSAEQREMIGRLQSGGYTVGQIARLLRRPSAEVLSVLRQTGGPAGETEADAA